MDIDASSPETSATIAVSCERGKGRSAVLVFVDGEDVGVAKVGQPVECIVIPGVHELILRLDADRWTFHVDAHAYERITLQCQRGDPCGGWALWDLVSIATFGNMPWTVAVGPAQALSEERVLVTDKRPARWDGYPPRKTRRGR